MLRMDASGEREKCGRYPRIHHARNICARIYPRDSARPHTHAVACLRRDVGTNTQRGRRSAPGRLVSCLAGPSPGGPVRSLRRCENARPPAAAMSSCASLCSPGNRNMGRQPKPGPGHKTPHAGAGRQPLGIVRSHGEPGRALEEASWPPGAGNRPPVAEYGTRVPSLYSC